ncbi:arylphorin subunit beta-like [Neodiprion virginianus]|uniref:arylphorin subunit beta-like n=1 Tax=Neodiprion virginianus TaxID=2961670 RepID=UPI001EE729B5|nr:arylphorin subunit beta-like [Neodiprion virginianus]
MLRDLAIFAVLAISPTISWIANEEFLLEQKTVYELLRYIDQPEVSGDGSYYELGMSYEIEKNIENYNDEECVRSFLARYKKGMQPRGKVFSPFYSELLGEAIDLFRVFLNAKDFETLNKTAAWARIHMNEGMFAYSFSIAVIHHKATRFIRVPALHEIQPHLFFSETVIKRAQEVMWRNDISSSHISPKGYSVIPATYGIRRNAKNYNFDEEEQRLNYFRNDVSLAEAMHYAHLLRPFWLGSLEISDDVLAAWPPRGETFLWWQMHTLALYNMERLSNNLEAIKEFDWNYPLPYGHYPNASYPNGCQFPSRKNRSRIPNHLFPLLQKVRDLESRLSSALDTERVIDTDGESRETYKQAYVELLGNILEGNADSINLPFYGTYYVLAKHILGCAPRPKTKHTPCPSTLDHFALGHRDPMYWSLTQRIVNIYHDFSSHLCTYVYEELVHEDVVIQSVEVDPIFTYFEDVDYLISTGLKVPNGRDEPVVKVRQCRLNHLPYRYNITVKSARVTSVWVRVFLGPKYDFNQMELSISENYKNFLLLNVFTVNLENGTFTIQRNSTQDYTAVPEDMSGDSFYEKVTRSLKDINDTFEMPWYLYALKLRNSIPKGRIDGLPLRLFVYIGSPIDEFIHTHLPLRKSITFPLDRPLTVDPARLPNAYFKDVKIYHKERSKIKHKTRETN